jgi:hypothetical protein
VVRLILHERDARFLLLVRRRLVQANGHRQRGWSGEGERAVDPVQLVAGVDGEER